MGLEGSSIMPTLDPFEHFHRGTGYASLAQALRRCIAVGDPARDTDLFRPIQEDVGNTDISVVVSAVFREVYLRHGGSDAKPPTDLEWLLKGCDKQKASPDLKEFNGKLATNVFDHGSTFHLNSATSLAVIPITSASQPDGTAYNGATIRSPLYMFLRVHSSISFTCSFRAAHSCRDEHRSLGLGS